VVVAVWLRVVFFDVRLAAAGEFAFVCAARD
jgi:hypothetical protein